MKGASGVAKTRVLKYRKSFETAPPPPPPPKAGDAYGRDPARGGATAANPDQTQPSSSKTGEMPRRAGRASLFALDERRAVGTVLSLSFG